MLNSGCNCFLKFKTCPMIDEEETFLLFEGPKKEIDDIKKQENYNKFFNYSISNELDIIRNWKLILFNNTIHLSIIKKQGFIKQLSIIKTLIRRCTLRNFVIIMKITDSLKNYFS